MTINTQGSTTPRQQTVLPRNSDGANQQSNHRTQAAQQLNSTWGKPNTAILQNLLQLILSLIQQIQGFGPKPDPKPGPLPEPTPQPVYGTIQPPGVDKGPPIMQPVYGVILPPEKPPIEKPPIQPVYGVIQAPEDK
ncbi:MAG: hypothetical protein CSA79_00665 [Thiothrix nivea]|nr:MAG: hypothetical protein CSA79_00665 [Thiothrix nivea]